MQKLLVELVGTFVLVFTIIMTVVAPGAGSLAPIAIGAALMIMVYANGHISGAHFNPAVSLGVALRGGLAVRDMLGYWIAQLVGALLAVAIAMYLKGVPVITPMVMNPVHAWVAELIGAFVLVHVVLGTATVKATEGNSYYGLAIGATVTVMAFALGAISGGAFNPAVALGIGVANLVEVGSVWIHISANLVGAALAAVVFRYTHAREC